MDSALLVEFTEYLLTLVTFSKAWAIGMHIVFWGILVTSVIISADQSDRNTEDNKSFKSALGLLLLLLPIFIIGGFLLVKFTPLGKM